MSFLRVAAVRSSSSAFLGRSATRAVRRTTSQPCLRVGQQSGRRTYASAVDTVKKTSDLPWAATATLVTAVGTYIALSPSEGAGHGHDDHGDHGKGHGDHAEEPKEESKDEPEPEPEAKEESSEKAEAKDEDKPAEEEKPAKEESKDEGKSDKEEDKKEDDSASSEESKDDAKASDDTGAKGESQKGATKNKDDVKHREEDSGKGSTKVRLDSPAGKTIGEGVSSGEGDAQAKTQRGVSNTDTKHSSDPHADPGKSSKGEGTAETAKIKGTVKPDRPQV